MRRQEFKTMHLLSLVDPVDDTYRRQIRQLTVQESRHRLARVICHGKRGQSHQAYRQEDQRATRGLALNAVTLWMTRYPYAAIAQLRAQRHPVRPRTPRGCLH